MRRRRLLAIAFTALVGLGALATSRCASQTRVATFNIRFFPDAKTDRSRVAAALVELDADLIGVQEITDRTAFAQVLAMASEQAGRDYEFVLSHCRTPGAGLTTGVVWDAKRWHLDEHRTYPELRDDDGSCGIQQPGMLGVFHDDEGERLALLSVHFQPFPRAYDERKAQWGRLLALQRSLSDELDVTVIAVGDYNSTGFAGEPPEEAEFVRGAVDASGMELLTDDVACTEYWRPEPSVYRPSILDHLVATDGSWSDATVLGMCRRLGCRETPADDMDDDFDRVSDHCPVVVQGTP